MNYVASQWNSADHRRQRHAREAVERLLVQQPGLHHARAVELLRQAAQTDSSLARRCDRFTHERAALQRSAAAMAIGGALIAVALIVFVSLAQVPILEQAVLIMAAGVSVAMFRLVVQPGRPILANQMLLQLILTMVLVLGIGAEPFGAAVALLGWAAALGRGWVESRTRAIDLAEMELALKVQGADSRFADNQRRKAAAI